MPKFAAKILDLELDEKVILNRKDAKKLKVDIETRLLLKSKKSDTLKEIILTDSLVQPGQVGLTPQIQEMLMIKENDIIDVSSKDEPKSFPYLSRMLDGEKLERDEILAIVQDIVSRNLSEVEMSAFILAQYFRDITMDEIEALTRATAETGQVIDFDEPVYDKHSIGGVPGNKVSLLIVPIVAAAGLPIPKTSSRAITSPAGTADTFEVLAPVEFSADELVQLIKKVRGALVWGGTLNIAPADDILIDVVEHPLKIDPVSQMLSSIMSKKIAVGVDALVLDIPIGIGTKVPNKDAATELSRKFVELGTRLNVRVEIGITYGDQPVGHAIGPALEAKEALESLMGGKKSTSLVEKSIALAGMLIEMSGKTARGQGRILAKEILNSGKALEKMKEIIDAQGGNPNIKPDDIQSGEHRVDIPAPVAGYIVEVNNISINEIAKAAGAPDHKGAGLYIYKKRGGYVKRGEPLLTIYSETASKLREAQSLVVKLEPITIEGMLLKRVSAYY
ncbi:MAG: AMP phosphorylase [Candidatus Hodarchaeota archaeon]